MGYKRKRQTKISWPAKKRAAFKKPFAKKAKKINFTRKRTNVKKMSIKGYPKKAGTSHWLTYSPKWFGQGTKYDKKFLKGWEKANAPNFNSTNYPGLMFNASAGYQSYNTLTSLYSPYDLAVFNGGPGANGAGNDARVILESVTSKIFFTNQSNSPVFVDLYDIQQRRDILNYETHEMDPASCCKSNTVGGDVTKGYVGTTPFQCELFTQNYKVLRVTRINLAPGETVEHSMHLVLNLVFKHDQVLRQMIDFSTGTTLAQDAGGLAHFTRWVMATTVGAPGDADNATISDTATKVDYVVTKQYRWTPLTQPATTNTYTNGIGQVASHIMSEPAGVDQASTSA